MIRFFGEILIYSLRGVGGGGIKGAKCLGGAPDRRTRPLIKRRMEFGRLKGGGGCVEDGGGVATMVIRARNYNVFLKGF